MKYDMKEIKKLPDIVNKEQLREVCHISKKTASFYLQSGLLPCTHNGKLTRCYSIKKKDLIQFLEDLQENPARYFVPASWYKGASYSNKIPDASVYIVLNKEKMFLLLRYYDDKMRGYPNLMSVEMVSEFTGYAIRTVRIWCGRGRLKSFIANRRHWVPKVYLKEFLASEGYNDICKKSEKHIQSIANFKRSRYGNELLSVYFKEEKEHE